MALPVTNLEVRPEPFTPSGSTIVELFDGRRKLDAITWGYRVLLSWDELRGDQDKLRAAIQLLIANPNGLDVMVGRDGLEDRVIPACIPDLSGEELRLLYERRMRKRPGSLTLVTTSQSLPLYDWLTSNQTGISQ